MTLEVLPAFGLPAGGMELAIILLIAVLLFGANKIPKLARSTGQAMGEFQRGREEIEQELEEMQEPPSSDSSSSSADVETEAEAESDDADSSSETDEK